MLKVMKRISDVSDSIIGWLAILTVGFYTLLVFFGVPNHHN